MLEFLFTFNMTLHVVDESFFISWNLFHVFMLIFGLVQVIVSILLVFKKPFLAVVLFIESCVAVNALILGIEYANVGAVVISLIWICLTTFFLILAIFSKILDKIF